MFILIPDGVSLKNFAYSSFHELGAKLGYEITYWNQTPFDLEELGFQQIRTERPKPHFITDLLKTACIRIELALFAKRDNDPIYHEYVFPMSGNTLRQRVKRRLVKYFIWKYKSEAGLKKIRSRMLKQERKSDSYTRCREILEKAQPDLLFCASQRSVTAIAAVAAATDLGIPTAAFIFSWDNLPKATTVLMTDHYLVWSEHMKQELLHYQRYIEEEQVHVTGTPQFESHFTASLRKDRETFFKEHGLDSSRRYICFSGDDQTTSPTDELYLRDTAAAVRILNNKGHKLGIIFRRCPVDFSERYNGVLEDFRDVISPVEPAWEKIGDGWNTILPLKKDLEVQTNVIAHTDLVVNLGSSMVFDYVSYGKPCAFINFNYLNKEKKAEEGVYVYDFVHFRSMPSADAVVWLNRPEEIAGKIESMLEGVQKTVTSAQQWFEIINLHPPEDASRRIWKTLEACMLKP